MTKRVEDIHFDALRNAIYHSSRRGFFDSITRWLNFIIVVSGTSAVVDLASSYEVFAAIAAIAGLLQLVFDFAGRTRTHEFLQRRFYEILADVTQTTHPKPIDIARWEATINRVYGEEPPPMRALDAISYNAAVESLGRGKDNLIKVNFIQSLLRNWYPFNGTSF